MKTRVNWKVVFCLFCVLSILTGISPSFADRPPDQVLIEARIVETSGGRDQLGVGGQGSSTSPGTSSGMPSSVTLDADGNYILPSGERLTPEQFLQRHPIWSGLVLGAPPAASDSVDDFYMGLSGFNFYRGSLRGFRFSGDPDGFGDSYRNPTGDPWYERWGRNHYPLGPDIRFRVD